MYGLEDYARQTTEGAFRGPSGSSIFVTKDGKEWTSIGCVEFGNNEFHEVMVLISRPTDKNEAFRPCQFPVYLMSHDDGGEDLGVPLPDFMDDAPPHHLPTIIIQLGRALADYAEESEQ